MADLKFTKTHEWLQLEHDDIATLGISDHAQQALGDLVFIELPEEGEAIHAGDEIGVVESVKAASDIYAPISGVVIETNQTLKDNPALVNTDPYGQGWLIRIRVNDLRDVEELLDAEDYEQTVAKEG